jgi:hypothetical protein
MDDRGYYVWTPAKNDSRIKIWWFKTKEDAEMAAAMLGGHLMEARYRGYATYPTPEEKNMKDADGK